MYGQIVFYLFIALLLYYAALVFLDLKGAKASAAGRGNEAKEEDIDISEDAAAFAPSVATYDAPSLGTRTDGEDVEALPSGTTGDGHPAGERAEDEEEPEGPAPRAEAGEGKASGEGAADKGAPGEEEPGAEGEGGAAGEVPPSRPGARTTVFPHPPLTVGDLRKKLRDDPGFSETIRMVRKAA